MSAAPAAGVMTFAEAADRLQSTPARLRALVSVGRLNSAGREFVTRASVDAEVAHQVERVDMVARGEWLRFDAASDRLGLDFGQVSALARAGQLDQPAPDLVTAASVDAEVARRGDTVPQGEWLTVDIAADRLKCSALQVRKMVAGGVLDVIQKHPTLLVPAASVEREVTRRGTAVAS